MALKDLKSDLGKFRSVIKPDGKAPDPPKPVEFGKYTPVSYIASTYKNASKFTTPSLLSFGRPNPDEIDQSDVTKLESDYDNDNIKKYNLQSKLEDDGITIKNKPDIAGNNEESPVSITEIKTAGNNESSPINIKSVSTQGNNEVSPIEITPVDVSGNNEKTPIQISKVDVSGNNESSDIIPIKSNLESKQLTDNSELNLDRVLKTKPDGRHEDDNSDLNRDGKIKAYDKISKVVKFDSTWNIDGTPQITMAGGRYELPKKSNYGFLGESPSTDFFSNLFFTGFTKKQTATSYTGNTSVFSFKGNSTDAPATDFFGNINVSEGFNTFAKLGETKFLFNSQYANIGAVDFFTNTNVSDGFTLNMKLYESKFLNNSQYGNISSIDAFSNQFAIGFTERYNTTQFNALALDYGLKGNTQEVDFFKNINVTSGFHAFAKLGDSKFIIDSSQFTWAGNRTIAPAVNFFSNTNAAGFTTFQNSSQYVIDSSIYTWKGSAQNAPEANFFSNTNATGFTKFAFGQPTQFVLDSSRYTWVGGRNNAPAVDFFSNINRDGFKTFNKLYESYYKFDSTILHEVATTPSELARTGGSTYKLNSQLIKSPLFNNLGFTGGNSKYTEVLKTKQFNSILGETANKRNSPSLLDTQYNKLDLTTDSFNPDYINQPYILRGIQNPGEVENERWGAPVAIADGLIRGGALTVFNRTIADVKRVTKFMISAKGIGFITKQIGLHLTSQNQETDPTGAALNLGLNPVKIYNPVAQLLSVAGNPIGQHFTRHGLIPILSNNRYETAVKFRNENDTQTFDTIPGSGYQNRLLQLTKELLFPITDGYQLVNQYNSISLRAFQAKGVDKLKYLTYYDKSTIDRLSYLTGPGSVYGIGATIINRAVNSIPKDSFQLNSNKLHYAYGEAHDHPRGIIPIKTLSSALNPSSDRIIGDMQEFWRYAIESAEANSLFIGEGLTTGERAQFNLVPMWAQMKSPFQRKLTDAAGPYSDKRNSKYQHGYAKLNQTVPPDGYKQSVIINQIQSYATLDYLMIPPRAVRDDDSNVIQKRKLQNKLKDFRWGLGETEMTNEYPLQKNRTQALRAMFTNPKIADFEKNNLVDRFGFGDHGKVGLYRDNPTRTHRGTVGINGEFVKQPRKFIGDRVQLIDFKPAVNTEDLNKVYELDGKNKYGFDGAEDLIEFYVSGPKKLDRCIVFRASLTDIQDNFNPSYNTIKYLGRADPIYLYSSFERSVSVSFQIGITSRDELRSRWRSLNALAAYTAPEYLKNGRMRAPLMKLTLGHLFRRTPVFINGLNFSFDNSQTTWETAKLALDDIAYKAGDEKSYFNNPDSDQDKPLDPSKLGVLQLPKFINVKMDLKIIGNYRPQLNGDPDNNPDMGIMYNLYETNDGYLPPAGDTVRVNYFSDSVIVQDTKQANVTDQVQPEKEGKKTPPSAAPAVPAPPPRTTTQTTLSYPYVSGDIVIEGVYAVSDYPKIPLPSGYVLVKWSDTSLRFVSTSLLAAKAEKCTIIDNIDAQLRGAPSNYKIQIMRLAE